MSFSTDLGWIFHVFLCFSVNFGIEEGFKIELKFHIDFERDLGSLGARLGTPLAPIWEPCGALGGPWRSKWTPGGVKN